MTSPTPTLTSPVTSLDTTADEERRRDGSSVDQQLHQASRENEELQRSVERLHSDARRLRAHNVALQTELDRLGAAHDHFRAELREFLPDSGSVDASCVTEAVREMKNKTRQLQSTNSTLQARIAQLEYTSVSDSTELR